MTQVVQIICIAQYNTINIYTHYNVLTLKLHTKAVPGDVPAFSIATS